MLKVPIDATRLKEGKIEKRKDQESEGKGCLLRCFFSPTIQTCRRRKQRGSVTEADTYL